MEVMIALVVLLLVSLGLMQTALMSIDSNMLNVIRDEATSINQQHMSRMQNAQFDDMDADGATDPATLVVPAEVNEGRRLIGRNANFQYTTTITVTTINDDTKRIDSTVSWTWKGRNYSQTMSTIRMRPST